MENIEDESKPLLSNNNDQELEQIKGFFDPRTNFYRYFGLIFICMLTFGPYYCQKFN